MSCNARGSVSFNESHVLVFLAFEIGVWPEDVTYSSEAATVEDIDLVGV